MPVINSSSNSFSRGFSMIEVLVAILIFSIGLLGVAGMQATALKLTRDGYLTTTASNSASDILEQIRLNRQGRRAGAYNNISGTQTLPGCVSTTNDNGESTTDVTDISSCSPQEIAQVDAFLWITKINDELPSGEGTVQFNNGIFTVTLTWKELIDGVPENQSYVTGSFL